MKRSIKELQRFEDFEKELFKDPAFRRAAQKVEHEYLLAKSLISLRNKRNMSQGELAKLIGSKQPVISRLESGRVKPSIALLERIASAFNASLEIKFRPLR